MMIVKVSTHLWAWPDAVLLLLNSRTSHKSKCGIEQKLNMLLDPIVRLPNKYFFRDGLTLSILKRRQDSQLVSLKPTGTAKKKKIRSTYLKVEQPYEQKKEKESFHMLSFNKSWKTTSGS